MRRWNKTAEVIWRCLTKEIYFSLVMGRNEFDERRKVDMAWEAIAELPPAEQAELAVFVRDSLYELGQKHPFFAAASAQGRSLLELMDRLMPERAHMLRPASRAELSRLADLLQLVAPAFVFQDGTRGRAPRRVAHTDAYFEALPMVINVWTTQQQEYEAACEFWNAMDESSRWSVVQFISEAYIDLKDFPGFRLMQLLLHEAIGADDEVNPVAVFLDARQRTTVDYVRGLWAKVANKFMADPDAVTDALDRFWGEEQIE